MKDTTVEQWSFQLEWKKLNINLILHLQFIYLRKYNYELNLKLQGKGVFAHELYAAVKSFQVKLMLFQGSWKNTIMLTFQLSSCKPSQHSRQKSIVISFHIWNGQKNEYSI
jgi:hypothetical protein